MKYLVHCDANGLISSHRLDNDEYQTIEEQMVDVFRYDIVRKLKVGDTVRLREFNNEK